MCVNMYKISLEINLEILNNDYADIIFIKINIYIYKYNK